MRALPFCLNAGARHAVPFLRGGVVFRSFLFLQGCLGGSDSGDWNAERRTAYIVETGFVAELNGCGIAAVLPADANLEFGICLSSALHSQFA